MTLRHQYTTTRLHRIVKLDANGLLEESTDWVSYQNIATFTTKTGITYMAVTQYFTGVIEPDVIYQLSKTEYKSERLPRRIRWHSGE